VSNGCGGDFALSAPAFAARDLALLGISHLDLRLGVVLLGRPVPMTTYDLFGWCLTHRPCLFPHSVCRARVLLALGEGREVAFLRVLDLLAKALRSAGTVLLSVEALARPSAPAQLGMQFV